MYAIESLYLSELASSNEYGVGGRQNRAFLNTPQQTSIFTNLSSGDYLLPEWADRPEWADPTLWCASVGEVCRLLGEPAPARGL